jgi:hypothetical protein
MKLYSEPDNPAVHLRLWPIHLRLSLPSGVFFWRFQTKILHSYLTSFTYYISHLFRRPRLSHFNKLCSVLLHDFPHSPVNSSFISLNMLIRITIVILEYECNCNSQRKYIGSIKLGSRTSDLRLEYLHSRVSWEVNEKNNELYEGTMDYNFSHLSPSSRTWGWGRMKMELHRTVRITGRNLIIILIEIRNTSAYHTRYLYASTQS